MSAKTRVPPPEERPIGLGRVAHDGVTQVRFDGAEQAPPQAVVVGWQIGLQVQGLKCLADLFLTQELVVGCLDVGDARTHSLGDDLDGLVSSDSSH